MVESERFIDIRQASVIGFLRIGETFTQRTLLEPIDEKTQQNLETLGNILPVKPALILDLHSSTLNPFHTGLTVTHNTNIENIIAPVAANNYFFPPLRFFYSAVTNMPGIKTFPVLRKYDNPAKLGNMVSLLYQKLFNHNEEYNQPKSYFEQVETAINESWPNTIIFSATFKKNKPHLLVHNGVRSILKMGLPAFFTASYLDKSTNLYHTFVSEPLPNFDKKTPDSEINMAVGLAHHNLAEHAFQSNPNLTTEPIPNKEYLSALMTNSFLKTSDRT